MCTIIQKGNQQFQQPRFVMVPIGTSQDENKTSSGAHGKKKKKQKEKEAQQESTAVVYRT